MAYIRFQPSDYFNTVAWTGTASSPLNVTGFGFQPDWVWNKYRSGAGDHQVYDSVRGVTKMIIPNANNAESTNANGVTAFITDGYTVGSDLNVNGGNSVGWGWKAGTTSGLSGGTITPTAYSIDSARGFGIYQTTGTGSAGTIAHGLGKVPKVIISHRTSHTGSWVVYHEGIGNAHELYLNQTDAASTASATWNSTTPTSTVWSVGADQNNTSGYTIISYVFAPVTGFSNMGKYKGNGSAHGPFIHTGFKPAWLLVKRTDSAGYEWVIMDNKRSPSNQMDKWLYPNSNAGEDSNGALDFCSNGFKVRQNHSYFNASGATYVFMAFAEHPFVASNGDPATAR